MNLFASPRRYPSQIWLLFWGTLLGSTGQALVWPFLTIYIRERLDVPLTTITLLFTLQSVAGFVATATVGPLMDRLGRKMPMIAGLAASSMVLVGMSQASTLTAWAVLLPLYGAVNTLFRIGSYAMVADLVESQRRVDVYSLLRIGDNLGIVAGPALGGFLVSVTYALSYGLAAALLAGLALIIALRVHETLHHASASLSDSPLITAPPAGMGYGPLVRDRPFLALWSLYMLVQIASSMVFVLLGLYVKENFGIPENRFGLIVGVNAVMVVLFQYAATRAVSHRAPLPIIGLGALFYAAGVGTFALSRSFGSFLAGMVILTVGELLVVPTTTAVVANMAPPDMRARYMGVFSLSFRIASGIGPVLGGLLSDYIAPGAMWYGGMAVCLVAAAGFGLLARHAAIPIPASGPSASEPVS